MRGVFDNLHMNLASAPAASPFLSVTALAPKAGPAPATTMVDWREEPSDTKGLVSVRYHGTDEFGHRRQRTVTNDPFSNGEPWYEVVGTLDDAVRAAREVAVADGYDEDPAAGVYARSSAVVLAAREGAWHVQRLTFPEGMGDGMDALISMPIDIVDRRKSDVSVPYGAWGARGFDVPDRIGVRINDPRVAAVVGVDSVVYAPKG